jgi:hypothetical protein
MALAISQLNRQAATAFWNASLDVLRITLAPLAEPSLSKGKSAKNEHANKYRRQPQAKNLDYNVTAHSFLPNYALTV